MLHATLTRESAGRPTATLGVITITPRGIPHRFDGDPERSRYDAHIVTGGDQHGEERREEHVYIPEWEGDRPGVDLLERALTLSRIQRDERNRGVETVALSVEFATYMLGMAQEHIGECGTAPDPEYAAELEQLEIILHQQRAPLPPQLATAPETGG